LAQTLAKEEEEEEVNCKCEVKLYFITKKWRLLMRKIFFMLVLSLAQAISAQTITITNNTDFNPTDFNPTGFEPKVYWNNDKGLNGMEDGGSLQNGENSLAIRKKFFSVYSINCPWIEPQAGDKYELTKHPDPYVTNIFYLTRTTRPWTDTVNDPRTYTCD